jgi:hypothetical protein
MRAQEDSRIWEELNTSQINKKIAVIFVAASMIVVGSFS